MTLDLVALFVFGLELWAVVGAFGFFEHLSLVFGAHRGRLAVGADEVAYAFGFLDEEPDFFGDHAVFVEFKFDENVTGVELAVAFLFDTALHGADALDGDQHPADDGLDRFNFDFAVERIAHSVFFIARDSQDEKLHKNTCQF